MFKRSDDKDKDKDKGKREKSGARGASRSGSSRKKASGSGSGDRERKRRTITFDDSALQETQDAVEKHKAFEERRRTLNKEEGMNYKKLLKDKPKD